MQTRFVALLIPIMAALPTLAQVPQFLSVRVADETAPPGGIAQIKVEITEPKPIITGDLAFGYERFMELEGISLFSAAGDASGAAVVDGGRLRLRLASPSGSLGMTDYPFLVMAFAVAPSVAPGTTVLLELGADAWWTDPAGVSYAREIKPGLLTVGGTLAINNVRPGGGFINAGETIFIDGMGFDADAKVSLNGFVLDTVEVLSPHVIRVVTASAGRLDATRVRVENGSGERDEYYSYDRIKQQLAPSANALLAVTVPLFSQATHTEAVFTAPAGATGIAFENANRTDFAGVLLETYAGGVLTGSADWMMPPHSKLVREIFELIPAAGSFDTVRVVSSVPMRALMLKPDAALGVVEPVPAASIR